MSTAQVLKLMCQRAPTLDLPETRVEPDPRVAIAGTPHPGSEVHMMDDDVGKGAKLAPRVGQHARDARSGQ